LGLAAASARAELRRIELPILVPDAFLRQLLVEQVFTDPGETLRVEAARDPCSQSVLSNPEVTHPAGRIRITARVRAQAGVTLWVDGCVDPLHFDGFLDVDEEVSLEPGTAIARFRVADSQLRGSGGWLDTPRLWNWMKPLFQPRFETLRVDLGPLVEEIRTALPLFAADRNGAAVRRTAESFRLVGASVEERGLVLRLGFEVDVAPTPEVTRSEAPLTPEQAEAFANALGEWDAFLTAVVKAGAGDAREREQRADLLAALIDARTELVAALQAPSADADARVRELFHSAWRDLAAALASLEGGPGGYRYLAFVASGDALAALDAAGPAFGFELTSDGLRRLARALVPESADARDPLAYSEEVDPELRRVFGFDLELPAVPPPSDEESEPVAPDEPELAPEAAPEEGSAPAPAGGDAPAPPSSALDPIGDLAQYALELFAPRAAYAAAPSKKGAPRPVPPPSPLDRKVPKRADLDTYLPQLARLLRETAGEVFAHGKLGAEHRKLFVNLILATAWKESCWRQYIARRGKIEPLRSSVGALGLMQVNPRVWRGFYSVDGLARSIHYNAHAGTEIAMHYLRDYAIAKGEAKHGGDVALARATYGVYNGGPRHLRRYREPKRWPADLREIDRSFLEKYEAVAAGRELSVRECF
jgi:soluble lytic murein transglycosylase-like protein